MVDTYSRYDDVLSVYYADLTPGVHTLTVVALENRPVWLDYVDTWGGLTLPEGAFEEHDPRVWRGSWSSDVHAVASGGKYLWGRRVNAWFPFTGDSVTYQAFAYGDAGEVELLVDGVSHGVFDLHSYDPLTRTISLAGLGNGPHVLHVRAHRLDEVTLDRFVTPALLPIYRSTDLPITRYEEDAPALRYDGRPFRQMPVNWEMGYEGRLSGRYMAWACRAGSTAGLTFMGNWAGIGFAARPDGGQAEVLIDGVSLGVVDTYSSTDNALSVYYDLLTGTHTLSVTVLGTRNPASADTCVYLDYVDVWNGGEMPGGVVEAQDARVRRGVWQRELDAHASGGSYLWGGAHAWFPFTGEQVSYRTMQDPGWLGQVEVLVDGVSHGFFDLGRVYGPITYTFEGLGAGPHVLHVRAHQGRAALDAFVAPGPLPVSYTHLTLPTIYSV